MPADSQPLSSSARPWAQRPSLRWHAALLVMVASGFAGLGYQIVWTQQSAMWLGHEAAAVLAVVTAFFGGLALGALALGSRIERSARPERWYAACEATIALWSLLLAVSMAPFSGWMLKLTGAEPSPVWQWTVAFGGTFVVLLPATVSMGATLPAMERVLARSSHQRGAIAALYAANTLGAVIGVLATAFWLVPQIGLVRTAALCAALNIVCAVAALTLKPDIAPGPPLPNVPRASPTLGLLAATGLLGIGYEVLVVRIVSQQTENTVYTFAMLLAVYLVGTALGAAAYQRWTSRRTSGAVGDVCHAERINDRLDNRIVERFDDRFGDRFDDRLRDRLLMLLALSCLIGTGSLWAAADLLGLVQRLLGPGMAAALAAEAALALAAFGLPTVVMGALFSHLASQAGAVGTGFGRALGINTLGAAAAPLLFGVVLLPWWGAKAALLLVAAAYVALSSRRAWFAPGAWATAAVVAAVALWAPPLVFVDVPEGGRIVSYLEGATAAVSVVEDADGVARLRIDNRQQEGSSASLLADSRQALLPLLLHPAPQRALFLGLGTGVTASAAAADATLQVDAAELLPEVIEASAHFTRAAEDGSTGDKAGGAPGGMAGGSFGDAASGPPRRLRVVAADARRFVRATEARYDVIVSDNFHPARSGSGALYTVEHFQAVQARLTRNGVFCQWLPLHQLDLESLRSIVQSFMAVYPGGFAMLATYSLQTPVLGLMAGAGAGRFDLRQLRQRLATHAMPQRLADFGIADEFALLGGVVAGPQALVRFAGDAALNTDDRPVVAYSAPRITYAPDSSPGERLLALLRRLDVEPAEIIDAKAVDANDAAAAAGWSQRMAAYWAARDRFIEAGQGVRPTSDVNEMLLQVREPLLAVLRISPDFRPAYDPLLRMAAALGRTDAAAARALLIELKQIQPARPEAAAALGRW